MPNNAFWRAVHSLAHPLTIAAILILLFNDHWLRWQQPSWLTGKLGDFTWLLFAPFIAALLFAWVFPKTHAQHERRVGLFSIGFIGAWFALAKTVPFFHTLTLDALNALMGMSESSLRMDATDLITLPALGISWYLWQHADNRASTARPMVYMAFGLGMLGTVATSMPEPMISYMDKGITRICQWNNQLITMFPVGVQTADATELPTHTYISADGGLTWAINADVMPYSAFLLAVDCSTTDVITDPANPAVQYHWQPNKAILRSENGGETWRSAYSLSKLNQEIRSYYYGSPNADRIHRDIEVLPAPIEALADARSGNIVFAMGQNGVLVRTPKSEYVWAQISDYYLVNLLHEVNFGEILTWHPYLFVMLLALALVTTAVFLNNQPEPYAIWVGALWTLFVLASLVAKPVLYDVNREPRFLDIPPIMVSIFMFVVLAVPLVIANLWNMVRNYRPVLLAVGVISLLAIGAYAFPFILWTTGSIARYEMAAILALLLVACTLAACYTYYIPRLPHANTFFTKTKRKNGILPRDAENFYDDL